MTMEKMSRRTLIRGGACAAAGLLTKGAFAAEDKSGFPSNFYWGASTAAHQIEGNNISSDVWVLENVKPTIYVDRSGDADDSYHRFEEDIALLRSFGLNAYRFSVEWARIEPTKGSFSNAELDYYKRVISACRKNGVNPSVTFHHNTSPAWFAAEGGWLNPDSPQLFGKYCDQVARHLSDQMEVAFTINEPQVCEVLKWVPGLQELLGNLVSDPNSPFNLMKKAAAKAVGSDQFEPMFLTDPRVATPNIIKAHHEGFAAIKSARTNLPTGVCLAVPDYQGVGPNSKVEEVKKYVFGDWIDAVKRSGDFVGVQNYDRYRIGANGTVPMPADAQKTQSGGEFYPQSLANAVSYMHQATGKPVIISEHGINTTDDSERIKLVDSALVHLRKIMREGVPVLGYYHWSLLDNYEWLLGYKPRYGLVEVDRVTFKRTPKPSATHYGMIARSNGVSLPGS